MVLSIVLTIMCKDGKKAKLNKMENNDFQLKGTVYIITEVHCIERRNWGLTTMLPGAAIVRAMDTAVIPCATAARDATVPVCCNTIHL